MVVTYRKTDFKRSIIGIVYYWYSHRLEVWVGKHSYSWILYL